MRSLKSLLSAIGVSEAYLIEKEEQSTNIDSESDIVVDELGVGEGGDFSNMIRMEEQKGIEEGRAETPLSGQSYVKRKVGLLAAFNAIEAGKKWCRKCQKEILIVNFERHITEVHSKEQDRCFVCEPPCNMSFKRQSHLDNHKLRTTCAHYVAAIMNIQCPHCKKSYHRQSQLDAHVNKRNCPMQFRCNQCEAGFPTNKNLKTHVSKEHKQVMQEKTQSCEVNDLEEVQGPQLEQELEEVQGAGVDQELEEVQIPEIEQVLDEEDMVSVMMKFEVVPEVFDIEIIEVLFEGEVDVSECQNVNIIPEWSQEVEKLCNYNEEDIKNIFKSSKEQEPDTFSRHCRIRDRHQTDNFTVILPDHSYI